MYPQHKAFSAGTNFKRLIEHLPKKTILTLMEDGLDASRERPKLVTKKMVDNADKLIVLCEKKYCPDFILNSKKAEFWDVRDPEYSGIPEVNKVKEIIRNKLRTMFS